MDSVDAAYEASGRGMFSQAYSKLITIGTANRTPKTELLRAELLERIGRSDEAKALALQILSDASLSTELKSGCELVVGRVAWEQGDGDAALKHMQHAVLHARQARNVTRLCWAQLRLIVLVAEGASPEAVAPLLGELRANAITLADPMFTAALHVGLAEIEAKRGLLEIAERHLDVAEPLLAESPNEWLISSSANTRLALAILRSDFVSAFAHGHRALAAAEASGSASAIASALINLGNAHFSVGAYDRAITHFERAARGLPRAVPLRLAVVETTARIRIAQGRLGEAEQLLSEIAKHRQDEGQKVLYIQRHAELTRIALLTDRGEWGVAWDSADALLKIARSTGDELLRLNALLQKTELALRRGAYAAAEEPLGELLRPVDSAPPEAVARFEGLLACSLRSRGYYTSAASHRERAYRLLSALRCEPTLAGLKQIWDAVVPQEPPPESTGPSTDPLSWVTTSVLLADRPDLVARELFATLVDLAAIRSGGVYSCQRSKQPVPLIMFGRIPQGESTTRIVAGILGDVAYEMVVVPNEDIASVAAIHAVELIASAVNTLAEERKRAQRRQELWRTEETATSGSVVNGEFRLVMGQATQVARTSITVLITGESGTGKEILARAIHAFSPRAAKPFIPFNCTAVPRDLIEAQMFGHRRGSFTGAERDHAGIVRAAAEGTLFLDEIGELGLDLQPKFLRFLESGEILPIGETQPVKVDVRVIAATNRELDQLVAAGSFREDLYYRLNVVRLRVPPLRERRDEIPALAEHFVRQAAQEFDKGDVRISADSMEYLLVFRWPGNIRQLANELRRIVVMADRNATINPEDLSPFITTGTIKPAPAGVQITQPNEVAVRIDQPLARATEHLERAMLAYAMKQSGGRLEEAAALLGLSRKGLYLKRQRLGLE